MTKVSLSNHSLYIPSISEKPIHMCQKNSGWKVAATVLGMALGVSAQREPQEAITNIKATNYVPWIIAGIAGMATLAFFCRRNISNVDESSSRLSINPTPPQLSSPAQKKSEALSSTGIKLRANESLVIRIPHPNDFLDDKEILRSSTELRKTLRVCSPDELLGILAIAAGDETFTRSWEKLRDASSKTGLLATGKSELVPQSIDAQTSDAFNEMVKATQGYSEVIRAFMQASLAATGEKSAETTTKEFYSTVVTSDLDKWSILSKDFRFVASVLTVLLNHLTEVDVVEKTQKVVRFTDTKAGILRDFKKFLAEFNVDLKITAEKTMDLSELPISHTPSSPLVLVEIKESQALIAVQQ